MPKIPLADMAVVPKQKVLGYLFEKEQSESVGKAVYLEHFGFNASNWELLAAALKDLACREDFVSQRPSYLNGINFVVCGEIDSPLGRKMGIQSVWFWKGGIEPPRLITAYPWKRKP